MQRNQSGTGAETSPESEYELGERMLLHVEKRARKLVVKCFGDYKEFLEELRGLLRDFCVRAGVGVDGDGDGGEGEGFSSSWQEGGQLGGQLESHLTSPVQYDIASKGDGGGGGSCSATATLMFA